MFLMIWDFLGDTGYEIEFEVNNNIVLVCF